MNYQLIGDAMQALMVNLESGEEIVAEANAMLFCNQSIAFDLGTQGVSPGGVQSAERGDTLTMTHFRCLSPGGQVCFSSPVPGKVQALELDGQAWVSARDAFLCATAGIAHEAAFSRRFGGFLSGESLVLLRASGSGTLFLQIGGAVVESTLEAGQTLRVDAGALVAFEDSVAYEIAPLSGFRNRAAGGEGLLLATLSGPGRVMLQTLPASRLHGHLNRNTNRPAVPFSGGIGIL